MSYENDEQARRARAAQNAQWASNSNQPQNPSPYQAGTFSNPDEPIIHTAADVPMDLLNSPSSHSIPGLPHNPAPLRRSYQTPNRQHDWRGEASERAAYNQSASSRGPPNVGYSVQLPNYYPQAPPNPGPGPSGSQTAQTHTRGPMSYPVDRQGGPSNREEQLEMKRKVREEKKEDGTCPHCNRPAGPGKVTCEYHLGLERTNANARRDMKRAEGKCYTSGCKEPAVAPGKRCQKCIDDAHARYLARSSSGYGWS